MINHKIFVSSKFREDQWSSEHKNVYWAKVYARFVAKYFGMIPIVPHLFHTSYLDDAIEDERDIGIEICKLEVKNANSIYFFVRDELPEESRMSFGMLAEYEIAERENKYMNFITHNEEGNILSVTQPIFEYLVGMNLHNA